MEKDWIEQTVDDDFTLMPPFQENEICSYGDMEMRIERLIFEIVG